MADPTFASELSPLDQIRLAEAEITRKIATVREVSERTVTNARAQSTLLKKQAHESGSREGRIHYKEIVSIAEEEARTVVEHGHSQADDLRQNGQTRMEAAIREAMSIVLALKGGGRSDES